MGKDRSKVNTSERDQLCLGPFPTRRNSIDTAIQRATRVPEHYVILSGHHRDQLKSNTMLKPYGSRSYSFLIRGRRFTSASGTESGVSSG